MVIESELATDTAVLGLIKRTDPVQAMLAEAGDRTAAERQALVDQLAEIDREANADDAAACTTTLAQGRQTGCAPLRKNCRPRRPGCRAPPRRS